MQVGAERGKLTPLGALRGTNIEFKGALEAPREAKSGSKIGQPRAGNEQASGPGPRGGVGEG